MFCDKILTTRWVSNSQYPRSPPPVLMLFQPNAVTKIFISFLKKKITEIIKKGIYWYTIWNILLPKCNLYLNIYIAPYKLPSITHIYLFCSIFEVWTSKLFCDALWQHGWDISLTLAIGWYLSKWGKSHILTANSDRTIEVASLVSSVALGVP